MMGDLELRELVAALMSAARAPLGLSFLISDNGERGESTVSRNHVATDRKCFLTHTACHTRVVGTLLALNCSATTVADRGTVLIELGDLWDGPASDM
jgi:hypothetical protein